MKVVRYFVPLVATVAAISLAACGDSTTPTPTMFNDSTTTLDVAASAGDAVAWSIETMTANETAAGASADIMASSDALGANPASSLAVVLTRTCFDVGGNTVANCTPITSVRKIATHVTADGSRTSTTTTTGGTAATWTGAVHRIANDTVTRVFSTAQQPVETSRIHTDQETAHDTTLFTEGTTTRLAAETAHDSVKAITFNLPRTSNPYPISGSIVRVDSLHLSITRTDKTETKDIVRIVTVTFPADAQGNVTLTVNGKTCTLNLNTHSVSACH